MISVIIPAFRADRFIGECLASITGQYDGDEILVGVDGCPATSAAARALMPAYPHLRVFDFPKNNGPYVVRNTLAYAARGSLLIFFDADDVMLPGFVAWTAGQSGRESAIRYLFRTKYESHPGRVREICGPTGANGVFAIRHLSFRELGGFNAWPCSADSEFHMRCVRRFGPPVVSPRPLFVYRKHAGSLTMRAETSSSSMTRRHYRSIVRRMRVNGFTETYIKPTFAAATEVKR